MSNIFLFLLALLAIHLFAGLIVLSIVFSIRSKKNRNCPANYDTFFRSFRYQTALDAATCMEHIQKSGTYGAITARFDKEQQILILAFGLSKSQEILMRAKILPIEKGSVVTLTVLPGTFYTNRQPSLYHLELLNQYVADSLNGHPIAF